MQLPFFVGMYDAEITSADTIGLVNALMKENLRLENVRYKDDLSVTVTVPTADISLLMEIGEKQGAKVRILRERGIGKNLKAFIHRPVLLAAFLLFLIAVCYLPSRILFVSVEGNTSIPTNAILETAANCGIHFGANRRTVRSEVIKNALLEHMPQLQWAGVNTKGCTAVISIREKSQTESTHEDSNRISSIVAIRDGIIQDCTILQGSGLCSVGQAVKAGQTLVSGYVDSGLCIKGTEAKAEISALTIRDLELITPYASALRGENTAISHHYSIKIGKKLINFYKDSGNPAARCVKIYSEKYLTLPGGFRLPLCLVEEIRIQYSFHTTASDITDNTWLVQYAANYLQQDMIAGRILSQITHTETINDGTYFYGKYNCLEIIGVPKIEAMKPKD